MSEHNHAACACTQEHADAHDHAHGHEHGAEDKNAVKKSIFFIALALALVIGAYFVSNFWVALCMYLIAYLAVGREVLSNAFHNICRGEIFDENFLMVVATLGAFAIGDFSEAVAVMIFYNVGETLQDMAVAKSRANIASLMNIRPDFARTLKDGVEAEVAPETVAVGALILIKPGERVPLDCTVKSGEGAVDASALTGESMPIAASEGVALSSGSVNMNGVLTCVVTSVFADSTVQKILDLVSDASAKKASAEKFITRFAKIYTPCVMGAAALIALVPPLFFGWSTFPDWFYRGLIFLVVSCPCALVISI
ncbi:MAG: HAD-IC family P-type ATPase, partial [Ruthenibacterium sp.]